MVLIGVDRWWPANLVSIGDCEPVSCQGNVNQCWFYLHQLHSWKIRPFKFTRSMHKMAALLRARCIHKKVLHSVTCRIGVLKKKNVALPSSIRSIINIVKTTSTFECDMTHNTTWCRWLCFWQRFAFQPNMINQLQQKMPEIHKEPGNSFLSFGVNDLFEVIVINGLFLNVLRCHWSELGLIQQRFCFVQIMFIQGYFGWTLP